VLWPIPILAEERSDFDIRALSARRSVRTVRDKHFFGLIIADEMPTITVGAVIQLSHMMRHTFLHRMPTAKHIGTTAAERQPVGINEDITVHLAAGAGRRAPKGIGGLAPGLDFRQQGGGIRQPGTPSASCPPTTKSTTSSFRPATVCPQPITAPIELAPFQSSLSDEQELARGKVCKVHAG
jgi:hypothetical protein